MPESAGPSAHERARQLFRFLKAFAERNVPLKRTIADQRWSQPLSMLPKYPTIAIGQVELATANRPGVQAGDDTTGEPPLLSIKRPKTTRAPRPPEALTGWLEPGWESPDAQITVLPERNEERGGALVPARFEDDRVRVSGLSEWKANWIRWAEVERPVREAMAVFERFYSLRRTVELESEQVELMLGDGRLRWRSDEGVVDHPILLQRVELEFDADVPELRVIDTDRAPELYATLLQGQDGLSAEQLHALREELETRGYHPLERDATSGFLRRMVQLLAPGGQLVEGATGEPATADPVVIRDPILFLRPRISGYPAAFDRILEHLESEDDLPVSLTRLVGITPPAPEYHRPPPTSPWSEPPDVLLSKPANAEQVAIARALEEHTAVLVQGPPGTGKSHTIANLIGHLVAQGKRVLVTSQTTKALRVLRGQIERSLQPLCVAVLENDLEARTQMEQAVRGILARLTTADDDVLVREIQALTADRARLNQEIVEITLDLRAAREAEYEPIIIAGEPVSPAEAARRMHDYADGNDWIPGPLTPGAPIPAHL